MKIIIEATEEGKISSVGIQDGKCPLDTFIAVLFSAMDGATREMLKDASQEVQDYTYEHFNAIFDLFLRNVFPEPPEGYFELSDAALLYAQDKLIADMEKKGITFKEALDNYEKKAQNYLKHKREGLA